MPNVPCIHGDIIMLSEIMQAAQEMANKEVQGLTQLNEWKLGAFHRQHKACITLLL